MLLRVQQPQAVQHLEQSGKEVVRLREWEYAEQCLQKNGSRQSSMAFFQHRPMTGRLLWVIVLRSATSAKDL